MTPARLAELEFKSIYTAATVRELIAAVREKDAEILRLRRIILEDVGSFTRAQIEALLAPEGERDG